MEKGLGVIVDDFRVGVDKVDLCDSERVLSMPKKISKDIELEGDVLYFVAPDHSCWNLKE